MASKIASPAGSGAHEGLLDEIRDRVGAFDNATRELPQAVRAELIGSDECRAQGLTARSSAPVLAICRKLIEAGVDPKRSLHAYRGNVLCLTVRSIGEGARLTVDEHNGVRLARWKPFCASAVSPRIAPFERAATTLAGAAP